MEKPNTGKNEQIIVKGEDKTDTIREWHESDGTITITYRNGATYIYNAKNVRVIRSVLADDKFKGRFEYLKRIAETVGLKDEQGNNILAKRYNNIDFISEESLLAAFLTGTPPAAKQSDTSGTMYPFGFNLSQKAAIDKALSNPLTIIEGPPGTGKTQTILNIIANAVMRGMSVAVVSSNNSTTANVLEKLRKEEVDFIAAYLGSADNKAKFIEAQTPLPDMSAWKLSAELKRSTRETLGNLSTFFRISSNFASWRAIWCISPSVRAPIFSPSSRLSTVISFSVITKLSFFKPFVLLEAMGTLAGI